MKYDSASSSLVTQALGALQPWDYFKELAVRARELLLDVSDLVWEKRGGEGNESVVNIVITKGRTECSRMWKAEGFICLSSCKKERKSGRKEEVTLNLAENGLFNCCGGRRKSDVLCVRLFLTALCGEIQ